MARKSKIKKVKYTDPVEVSAGTLPAKGGETGNPKTVN